MSEEHLCPGMFSIKDDIHSYCAERTGGIAHMGFSEPRPTEDELRDYVRGFFVPDTDSWGAHYL